MTCFRLALSTSSAGRRPWCLDDIAPGSRARSVFTGSVETGSKVARRRPPDLKRVTLELGGNDPAIVLDDADPAIVASALFASAFNNNGQVLHAIKRAYVPEALYD